MTTATLPAALTLMFGAEGGYTNNTADKGNWLNGQLVGTKYGVTGKTLAAARHVHHVSAEDVKALTLAEAEEIYRKSYWSQSGGDLLPAGLDYAAFDFGVNSGPATAVKHLQKVVGVAQDGIVGMQTVAACERYPGGIPALIRAYCDERMAYLRDLSSWRSFGRGWTIRVTGKDPKGQFAPEPGVVGNALKLATGSKVGKAQTVPVATGKAAPSDKSLTSIIRKPEAWGPLAGLVSAAGSLFAGNGPVQWALAAALVVGVGIGVYAFVQRQRRTA